MLKTYEDYIKTIKVGDKVYPAYDSKGSRVTVCEVIAIDGSKLTVKGYFWAEQETETTAVFTDGAGWVKYNEKPTLMEMLGVTDDGEEGDYYRLIDPDYLRECYRQEYLNDLGLSK
jgi:hypothetical protein